MSFNVSIEQFDGPLDLMLHLIKENKLDLLDLNMDVLAEQYISYIHTMQHMHLEIASEYLTELVSLIEYKSKKLLPREEMIIDEEYEEDHRERLIQRLVVYQQYKEMTSYFKNEFESRQKLFTRPPASMIETWQFHQEAGPITDQSAYQLMKALDRIIRRKEILQPYETKMTIKELSVEERLEQIKERLEPMDQAVSLDEVCRDCTDLHMYVITFLAILDLIHQKWLLFQIDEKETIWVLKGNDDE